MISEELKPLVRLYQLFTVQHGEIYLYYKGRTLSFNMPDWEVADVLVEEKVLYSGGSLDDALNVLTGVHYE